MESAGFYFHLEPPNLMLGGGMYVIPDSLLGRFREAVADPKSGHEIGKIVAAIRARPGFTVEGLHYKRVPAGFDPAHPNAELLKHKGLYGGVEMKIPEEFFSREPRRLLLRAVRAAGAPPPLADEAMEMQRR